MQKTGQKLKSQSPGMSKHKVRCSHNVGHVLSKMKHNKQMKCTEI